MNKSGQFFTLIAIFLISLMFLSFELFSYFSENKSIKTRVSSMDSFLFSVEDNLERQLYISGFRILFLAENQITSSGVYIPDIDGFFQEAFFNATILGVPANSTILIGATYEDIVDSLNNKARKINVDITLNNSVLNISQNDPWYVNITLTSDFVMEDRTDLARWEKTQVISILIPVTSFEDPFFTINTYARISRKISQTPYEGAYSAGGDATGLVDHVDKGYYAANSEAPSFLDRFEGNIGPNINGIESFVNIPDLSAQALIIRDKSCIDYIYFSSLNPVAHDSVPNMPSWFKIDAEDGHDTKYGV
ncbi:MAG: hypothetical protein KKF48_00290 [Nanoarchaeota archaeon]|nr:hypothetical protein [Nanoarchaeota archaeon]MBU1027463.1 hypothetical protein [Nanoarchaeota archaeon]